jgi:hypothetical protein
MIGEQPPTASVRILRTYKGTLYPVHVRSFRVILRRVMKVSSFEGGGHKFFVDHC